MPRHAVEQGIGLWQGRRWEQGIGMPNGGTAYVSEEDMYHLLVDPRVWRHPERVEMALEGVHEIRSARAGRRIALTEWKEGELRRVGYIVLTAEGHVWTLHVVDDKAIRKQQRHGELIWKR